MDDTRFQKEYGKVRDDLFTYLVRMTASRDLAADILQEAAYKAYRGRRSFRGEASFKTWIYRIAINTMRTAQAKSARERGFLVSGQEPGPVSPHDPETLLARKEKGERLSGALELLDEIYRAPFLLKHVHDLTYREIGEVLDIGEGNARIRVYRARQALMGLMKEV